MEVRWQAAQDAGSPISPKSPGPVGSCWMQPCEQGEALVYSDRHPLVPGISLPSSNHSTSVLSWDCPPLKCTSSTRPWQITWNYVSGTVLLSHYPVTLLTKTMVMMKMVMMTKVTDEGDEDEIMSVRNRKPAVVHFGLSEGDQAGFVSSENKTAPKEGSVFGGGIGLSWEGRQQGVLPPSGCLARPLTVP